MINRYMAEKLIISFNEYNKIVEKLAITIHQNYKPTVLIGIMRGAAPIIDILSRILKLPIAYIVIQSYSGKGMEDKQGELMFAREISSLANEKDFNKVLLIDDLSDTGLTLNKSIEWLKNYGPTKNFIKDTILSNRNVVSVSPEITDPDYLYVTVNTAVKYDSTNTTLTAGSIEALLTNTIYQYGQSELGLFADQFRYSPLIKKIDETEPAIESSLTTVRLRRSFTPTLNVASSYTLKFSNEIPTIEGISQVSSTQFSHYDDSDILRTECSLQESNGVLQVFRTSGSSKIVVANNVGAITYSSGNVALTTFKPIAITDGTANVDVTVSLESNDVSPLREQILLISNNDITISMFDTGGSGSSAEVSNTSTSTTTTATTSTSSSSY